ncbi:MAG TPA: VCBS repeat-containing protein [Phycisphaerae bacterium]|nr:VCBS repeat-containing protein [Phycisphaerae bacterium]
MKHPCRNRTADGWPAWLLALAALALAATPARGLINPNYTPVDLVHHSKTILHVEIGPPDAQGALPVKVVAALQGAAPGKLALAIGAADEAVSHDLRKAIGADRAGPALLFAGDFSAAGDPNAAPSGTRPVGALHVGLRWFGLTASGKGAFGVVADPFNLQSVWEGSNRMLGRCLAYIQADRRADVPTAVDAAWDRAVKVAAVKDKVNALLAVDVAGDGKAWLHVLSDSGDRLLRPAGDGAMTDATAACRLAARSQHAAWVDSSGDGRLDLASWDGQQLSLHRATADGVFEAAGPGLDLPTGCLGLAAIDLGAGRAGLVVSTPASPAVVTVTADDRLAAAPVAAGPGEFPGKTLGQAGPCVAADFDGDGLTDVVQPFAKGALFYKGKGPGEFLPPAKAYEGSLSTAATAVRAADFDADAVLDILLAGREGCFFLRGAGNGTFEEVFAETGEVPRLAKPDAVGAETFDINADGRQDFVLLHPSGGPEPFFNRGFFCFGYAIQVALEESADLACSDALRDGQQAGAAADFSGDGAPDLALVSRTGEVWVLVRAAEGGTALGVTVALPASAAGPVTVVARDGGRCLGARVVRAGAPAFFGKVDKGPLALKWQWPGEAAGEQNVVVLGPTRFVLPPRGK